MSLLFKGFMDNSYENGKSNDSGFLNDEDDYDDEKYEIEANDVHGSKKQRSKFVFLQIQQ